MGRANTTPPGRDEIVQIPEPDESTYVEHDIWHQAVYVPGLNIDREAAPVEAAIAENVESQLEKVKPKRWKI